MSFSLALTDSCTTTGRVLAKRSSWSLSVAIGPNLRWPLYHHRTAWTSFSSARIGSSTAFINGVTKPRLNSKLLVGAGFLPMIFRWSAGRQTDLTSFWLATIDSCTTIGGSRPSAPCFPMAISASEAFHLESLGDAPYGPIHAVTWGAGRLDVFCVRTGGLAGSDLLYHYWQDPGVGFLKESLGDQYSARGAWATAVTWGPRRLDCFLTNNENDESGHLSSPLFHYWEDDSGSFAKESLGGIWPGGHKLSAVSWGPRRLDVFHVGFDRQLYHYWQG